MAKAKEKQPEYLPDDDDEDEVVTKKKELTPAQMARELAASKREHLGADGEILKYELEIQGRDGAPNPVNIPINEEKYVIRRQAKVVVPWWVVVHLANNIETKYTPTKDENGRLYMREEPRLSENFTARPINPAPGATLPY